MSWEGAEDRARQQAAGGKYFKLSGDGDRARIVLLSEPEEVEKDGANGAYTSFVVQVWTVSIGPADEEKAVGKAQQWDMGSSAFKGLLAVKRAIGLRKLYGCQLVVVRSGEARSMQTSYSFTPDGPIGIDVEGDIADAGLSLFAVAGPAPAAPAPAAARRAPVPAKAAPTCSALEGGLKLATSLPELRQAFEAAWADADGYDTVQTELQAVYLACKAALEAPAAKPAAAAAKRAPAF